MEKAESILKRNQKIPTSASKPIPNAKNASASATAAAKPSPARLSRARAPWPEGVIDNSESMIRWGLRELRKRGLRNLKKHPPEPWEQPLTDQEREQFS